MWGATRGLLWLLVIVHGISIHAPRVGCDGRPRQHWKGRHYFNPRTPCGVRPSASIAALSAAEISIHAPRVGCDGNPVSRRTLLVISIHAPRVGCDLNLYSALSVLFLAFQSTHPVWGATEDALEEVIHLLEFQSTHPVWGATLHHGQLKGECVYFNPRTPCGVRRVPAQALIVHKAISIHAPRVGCDVPHGHVLEPVGGISIHAPRVGCDTGTKLRTTWMMNFNPRTPCGVRRD